MSNSYAFVPIAAPNSPGGKIVRVDVAVAACGHRIEGIAYILDPYVNPALQIPKGLGFGAIATITNEWLILQNRQLQAALAEQQARIEDMQERPGDDSHV